MSYLTRCSYPAPPRDLYEMLLRDVASLLVTCRLISRSLRALRPECAFSRELTGTLNAIIALGDAGETRLQPVLAETGATLPAPADTTPSTLVTGFLARLPTGGSPTALASELGVNLRLLAQHVELKARLAAEEARHVGQHTIGEALLDWSVEWRLRGNALRTAEERTQTQARLAEHPPVPAPWAG